MERVMVIYPSGEVIDEDLVGIPVVSSRIFIDGRNYTVKEVHESCISKSTDNAWNVAYIVTLIN